MPLKKYRPLTPTQRYRVTSGFDEITACVGSEGRNRQGTLVFPIEQHAARLGDEERPAERVALVFRHARPAVDGIARRIPGQDVPPATGDLRRKRVPRVKNPL